MVIGLSRLTPEKSFHHVTIYNSADHRQTPSVLQSDRLCRARLLPAINTVKGYYGLNQTGPEMCSVCMRGVSL